MCFAAAVFLRDDSCKLWRTASANSTFSVAVSRSPLRADVAPILVSRCCGVRVSLDALAVWRGKATTEVYFARDGDLRTNHAPAVPLARSKRGPFFGVGGRGDMKFKQSFSGLPSCRSHCVQRVQSKVG